jgi:hypothetical protein
MRRAVTIGATIVAVLSAAGLVAASGTAHHTDQAVNRQATAWTAVRAVASGDWQRINWDVTEDGHAQPADTPITVNAMGSVVVTVSATFSGGPVQLRVIDGGRHRMRPGIAHFDPEPGARSFSFTFLRDGGHPACGRNISVEWRRSSVAAAALTQADAVVTYKHDTTDHVGGCA